MVRVSGAAIPFAVYREMPSRVVMELRVRGIAAKDRIEYSEDLFVFEKNHGLSDFTILTDGTRAEFTIVSG